MSDEKHGGCRVCGRTDVTLKADGTLRMHAHTKGGNAWLRPGGNRCHGAGEPPKGVLGDAPNYSETPIDFPREAVSMEVKAAGEED